MIKLLWEKSATIALIVSILMLLHYWFGTIPIWYFVGIEVLVAVVLYEIVISLYTGYVQGNWQVDRNQPEKKRAKPALPKKRTKINRTVQSLSHQPTKERSATMTYDPVNFSDEFSESSEELESPLSSVIIDEESDRESDVSGVTIDISEVSAKEVEELGLQIEDEGSVEIE